MVHRSGLDCEPHRVGTSPDPRPSAASAPRASPRRPRSPRCRPLWENRQHLSGHPVARQWWVAPLRPSTTSSGGCTPAPSPDRKVGDRFHLDAAVHRHDAFRTAVTRPQRVAGPHKPARTISRLVEDLRWPSHLRETSHSAPPLGPLRQRLGLIVRDRNPPRAAAKSWSGRCGAAGGSARRATRAARRAATAQAPAPALEPAPCAASLPESEADAVAAREAMPNSSSALTRRLRSAHHAPYLEAIPDVFGHRRQF